MKTRSFVFAALLLLAISARAQEPPRFFIERITVTNIKRVSAAVIVSESLLREGHAYGEDELRQASDRIRRLPFVLDASFALQKGSDRGRYVLSIAVAEAEPLFYEFDSVLLGKTSHRGILAASQNAVIGARTFLGSHGVLHLGIIERDPQRPFTDSYIAAQAGLTLYDVFGTHALVTVAANRLVGRHTRHRVLPDAVVAIPFSPRQTLTAAYSASEFDRTTPGSNRILESRWSYNTTNHPFFATHGLVISTGPVITFNDRFNPFSNENIDTYTKGVELEVKKYWELNAADSIAAETLLGRAFVQQHGNDPRRITAQHDYGSGLIRFAHALHDQSASSQSRLELTLRSYSRGFYGRGDLRNGATEVSATWARRNAWGALRLGLGFAW
ncbi:MAG TPA: hypothetical protein VGQ46_02410 [Thermoanaerobaculia bacterium]|jgi:hypothetical protein|nr:hypothetical protein [Thermoanaerobaculia bacterium]